MCTIHKNKRHITFRNTQLLKYIYIFFYYLELVIIDKSQLYSLVVNIQKIFDRKMPLLTNQNQVFMQLYLCCFTGNTGFT